MNLSVVFLVIAFTCVMAIPTPKEEEDHSVMGPMMKSGFDMFQGMRNAMGDWMKGGMNFAKGVAETSKNMMMDGYKAAEKMAGTVAKSVGLQ